MIEERITIGMDPLPGFDVKAKLQGPSNSFFGHIAKQTGVQLSIRGKFSVCATLNCGGAYAGQGFVEPGAAEESQDVWAACVPPLFYLCCSACTSTWHTSIAWH